MVNWHPKGTRIGPKLEIQQGEHQKFWVLPQIPTNRIATHVELILSLETTNPRTAFLYMHFAMGVERNHPPRTSCLRWSKQYTARMPQSLKGKGEEVLREAVGKRGIRYFCCKQTALRSGFWESFRDLGFFFIYSRVQGASWRMTNDGEWSHGSWNGTYLFWGKEFKLDDVDANVWHVFLMWILAKETWCIGLGVGSISWLLVGWLQAIFWVVVNFSRPTNPENLNSLAIRLFWAPTVNTPPVLQKNIGVVIIVQIVWGLVSVIPIESINVCYIYT